MTARDLAAGLLVTTAVLVWAFGGPIGAHLGVRALTVVVLALGIAAALVAGWWRRPLDTPLALRGSAVLGVLGTVAAVVALVTAGPVALSALVLATVGSWLLATAHHLGARR